MTSGTAFPGSPVYQATLALLPGLRAAIARLPDTAAYAPRTEPVNLAWMIDQVAQHPDWPIDKVSRWVGFVQGVLAVHGALDTDAERDRSRPLFHAAYAQMGWTPPATQARDGASADSSTST